MADYRLHPITWKNVIDYNWLRLPHVWLSEDTCSFQQQNKMRCL
jgi:hypothetical protein